MPGEVSDPERKLFTSITVGDMILKHRIVMGPMTRGRSPGNLANDTNLTFYSQRATDGGLLITEGTTPSESGQGFEDVPRIYDEAGSKAWKKVNDAVHAKGGFICAQLWHTGRASASKFQKDGKPALSPSGGSVDANDKTKEVARPATLDDIKHIVSEFRDTARWAREAGFDAVELHGAHGYLIDEFLQSSTNQRTDDYGNHCFGRAFASTLTDERVSLGGSYENRSRFLFEVLDAVLLELPETKVAVRFSPWFNWQDCTDENPLELFSYVLTKLQKYKLAYIHFTEPTFRHMEKDSSLADSKLNPLLALVKAPTRKLATGGYLNKNAEEALRSGRIDLVGVARAFIVNPDFVERTRLGLPIRDFSNTEGWYSKGEAGYIDHPTYSEEKGAEKEVANELVAEMYTQRCSPGALLISEGVHCSKTAAGHPAVPGLLNAAQVEGWKLTTSSVHAKGAFIFAQLWHTGRAGDSKYQPEGRAPVSPSGGKAEPHKEEARILTLEEIKFIISEYQLSAKNARLANFDGIEIHAAHGYLINQFLEANNRTDEYGGSFENRARFLFEVLDVCLKELPSSKIAIRLSPYGGRRGMAYENQKDLYTYVIERLNKYNLAYLQLTEPVWGGWVEGPPHETSKLNEYRGIFRGPVMLTGGYAEGDAAEKALQDGRADLIGIGRAFITNPDYVFRVKNKLPLNPYLDFKLYYGGGAENYTSWPTWQQAQPSSKL
ncbi:hypothetical protein SmJEL517_g01922 [Synchytrium microbalum]|uniref:NADH:flavin oxidoreductase/NADH oxidase N-terminal domain-containing protein n=1 Tax=Synchytrium microbalum TaxID=1806994 RepID=A0A507C926_9FUNG|nr:uncharacterized protein SmJEL517_g01922 [Synchytrium microbalum]TPX35669.1 hypothetical protein SmJEL517_g01922 [Synchytrium microbalum]